MEHPVCPKCQSAFTCRNGSANGDPKRRCKDCGYRFTRPALRGFPQEKKDRAVVLHLNGLSLRATARLLSVTATSVRKWVREAALLHGQRPAAEPGEAPVVEVDEMWHYLKKKPANCGSGRLYAGQPDGFPTGSAGGGTKKL